MCKEASVFLIANKGALTTMPATLFIPPPLNWPGNHQYRTLPNLPLRQHGRHAPFPYHEHLGPDRGLYERPINGSVGPSTIPAWGSPVIRISLNPRTVLWRIATPTVSMCTSSKSWTRAGTRTADGSSWSVNPTQTTSLVRTAWTDSCGCSR